MSGISIEASEIKAQSAPRMSIVRRITPLLLSSVLVLTACEPGDNDPIATECQGKMPYGFLDKDHKKQIFGVVAGILEWRE